MYGDFCELYAPKVEREKDIIKTKCYDCGTKEIVENDMLGKKCKKCGGRLIPY